MRINLIVLYVDDLGAARRFYATLGLPLVREQHGKGPVHYSATLDGGVVLELYPRGGGAVTRARLGVTVADVDAVIAVVVRLFPQSLVSAAKVTDYGYVAVVKDPEGNKIEIRADRVPVAAAGAGSVAAQTGDTAVLAAGEVRAEKQAVHKDQYLAEANLGAVIAAARSELIPGDRGEVAVGELLDYVANEVLDGGTWQQLLTVGDFQDALAAMTEGIKIIGGGDDVTGSSSDALADVVGAEYGQSLDEMVRWARAGSPHLDGAAVTALLLGQLRQISAAVDGA